MCVAPPGAWSMAVLLGQPFEYYYTITSPSFIDVLLLIFAQGCFWLFYKNNMVYYNVYCYYCGVFIEKYVCTKFGYCVSE